MVIIALLILKPIFMRRNISTNQTATNLGTIMDEVIACPSVRSVDKDSTVIVQKEVRIEYIKDRFLNKSDSDDSVA